MLRYPVISNLNFLFSFYKNSSDFAVYVSFISMSLLKTFYYFIIQMTRMRPKVLSKVHLLYALII
jgi:hypothetical protein